MGIFVYSILSCYLYYESNYGADHFHQASLVGCRLDEIAVSFDDKHFLKTGSQHSKDLNNIIFK